MQRKVKFLTTNSTICTESFSVVIILVIKHEKPRVCLQIDTGVPYGQIYNLRRSFWGVWNTSLEKGEAPHYSRHPNLSIRMAPQIYLNIPGCPVCRYYLMVHMCPVCKYAFIDPSPQA